MVMAYGDDPEDSRLGYQGDGVDVEIARVRWKHSYRFQWTLYHEARLIKTGIRRTMRGARICGGLARWWYRQSLG